MMISWLGDAGLKLQTKDAALIIDPPSASTGLKPGKLTAEIVALTQDERRDAKTINGDPLIITSPGEYEKQRIFIYGLNLPSEPGRVHFRFDAEDISFGHIADLNHKLENGEAALFEGVDVLFVPVGGKSVINAESAAALVNQIEPRIVVPIQYHLPGCKIPYDPVEPFLKELGAKRVEPIDKWRVMKKDLPAEETQVILLRP